MIWLFLLHRIQFICSNRGTKFDWFNRSDHSHALDAIKNRADLSEAEKDKIIRNTYNSVAQNDTELPDWVVKHGIKDIIWDNATTIELTASEVAHYFGF